MNELIRKGYTVEREVSRIESFEGKKLAGLTAPKGNGGVAERGNMLPVSTQTAIRAATE